MIELNNLATLKNVTTDELGSILGGQMVPGGIAPISSAPTNLNNTVNKS